jgi:pyrroloquinoline quinone (PQQ) biosynthesis protein C
MKNYQQLINETEVERTYLFNAPIFNNLKNRDFTVDNYINFLKEAYHHVKYTVPLMMLCGSKISFEKETYRKHIVEYINEEYGHHEWILNDLEACGMNRTDITNSLPKPATQAMISYVKDQIENVNPLAFFGMVQVLEGTSIQVATQSGEIVKDYLKLPTKAFSYLFSHGSLDQEHILFFESLINSIEDEKDLNDIINTAKYVYIYYGDILRSI